MSKQAQQTIPQDQEVDNSIGTVVGARAREAANGMTDDEREEALQRAMEIIYGQGDLSLIHANRD